MAAHTPSPSCRPLFRSPSFLQVPPLLCATVCASVPLFVPVCHCLCCVLLVPVCHCLCCVLLVSVIVALLLFLCVHDSSGACAVGMAFTITAGNHHYHLHLHHLHYNGVPVTCDHHNSTVQNRQANLRQAKEVKNPRCACQSSSAVACFTRRKQRTLCVQDVLKNTGRF